MTHPWPQADPTVLAPVAEHDDLRAVVRQVLEKHADHEAVRAAADSDLGHDPTLWARLNGELEIGGLALPVELGGSGFGLRELGVVLEEVGAALVPDPVLSSAVLGARALALADDTTAHADLLAGVVSGEAVLAVGDEVASEAVVRVENGAYVLDGTVARVVHAGRADHLVLPARLDGATVLVLAPASALEVTPRTGIDPTRRVADVTAAAASVELLVGVERGARVVRVLELLRRAAVASQQAGAVSRLLDLTCEYVTQREQFSRPIGSFQAVKHRLADVLVDRERALSASRYAVAVLDPVLAGDLDVPDDVALAVEVAATVCQDAFVRAAHETVQLHGGIGFTWEHRAHYYVRRALADEGFGGGSSRSRSRIADLVGV